jgi:hypothetical protein
MRTRKAKRTSVERIIMEKINPALIYPSSKNIINFNNNKNNGNYSNGNMDSITNDSGIHDACLGRGGQKPTKNNITQALTTTWGPPIPTSNKMKNPLDAVKHVDVEVVSEDIVEQATDTTAGQVLTQCVSGK